MFLPFTIQPQDVTPCLRWHRQGTWWNISKPDSVLHPNSQKRSYRMHTTSASSQHKKASKANDFWGHLLLDPPPNTNKRTKFLIVCADCGARSRTHISSHQNLASWVLPRCLSMSVFQIYTSLTHTRQFARHGSQHWTIRKTSEHWGEGWAAICVTKTGAWCDDHKNLNSTMCQFTKISGLSERSTQSLNRD